MNRIDPAQPVCPDDQHGPDDAWQSVTETERVVADLVTHGLSNHEVADKLFLSRHTVDYHLRQLFRKLSIHSRVELARLVVEHERSGDPGG